MANPSRIRSSRRHVVVPVVGVCLLLLAIVAAGISLFVEALNERSTIEAERAGIGPAVSIVGRLAAPGGEAFAAGDRAALTALGYRSRLALVTDPDTYALASALLADVPALMSAPADAAGGAVETLGETISRAQAPALLPLVTRVASAPTGQIRRGVGLTLERRVARELDARLAARADDVAYRVAVLLVLALLSTLVGVAMLVRTLVVVRRGLAAEQEARQRVQEQLALADAVPTGLWTALPDAITVTWVSSRFAELTGVDDLVALGEGWFDVVRAEDRGHLRACLEAVRSAAPDTIPPYRYRIVDGDARERTMQEQACPVYRDGELIAFAGSTADITEEERVRRELEALAATSARGLLVAGLVLQAGSLDAAFAACAASLIEDGDGWVALQRDTADGLRVVLATANAPTPLDDRVLAREPVCTAVVGAGDRAWGQIIAVRPASIALLERVGSILASAILRLEAESRLAHDARHEPGSGLLRRSAFADVVTDVAASAPVTVVAFDLIDLDMIGAREGRGACEHLLTRAAIRIADTAGVDLPTRLGRLGDASVALLLAGRDTGRLDEIVAALVDTEQSPGGLRAAWAKGRPDQDGGLLVEHAETALGHAHRGRLVAVAYDEAFARRMTSRIQLDGDLRRAIANNELFLQFQPIVDLATGAIRRAESLVRWRAEDGMRGPDAFVPYAEESGLVVPLGRIVMFEACRVAARLVRELGPRAVPITINVSAEQLTRDDLAAVLQSAMSETDCPASAIALELTETAYLADTKESRSALEIVRALGVKLLLDDFGTGYSSLGTLHEVRADAIKLDRSLIVGFGEDSTATAIVAAAIAMTRALGIDTVAEGVETRAQAAILQAAGCRYGQGWLFARAMDEEEFINAVASDQRLGIAA